MTDAREIILQTLALHRDGITRPALVAATGLPDRLVMFTLRQLRKDQFADRTGHDGLWGTWKNTACLRARLAKQSILGVNQRQRVKRRDPDAILKVSDLPVVQRVVPNWAPVRVPPGPTSIFNWSQHA